MTTLPVKQQILDQATQLQAKFSAAQTRIGTKSPQDQVNEIQSHAVGSLSDDATVLTDLQHKVQATFLRGQEAIPNVSEEELLVIAGKLNATADILDDIQANGDIAFGIIMLAAQVDSIFTTIDPSNFPTEAAALLKVQATLLFAVPKINQGNKSAVQAIMERLSRGTHAPLSSTQPQQPVRGTPTHGVTPPRATTPPVQSSSVIIAEQNENYEVTSFVDQWKALEGSFSTPNPVADFEKVLAFYNTVKTYHSGKTAFLLSANKNTLETEVLQKAEAMMGNIINAQKEIEQKQANQVRSQSSSSDALKALQAAFEKYCEGLKGKADDMSALLSSMNATFKKFADEHPDERDKLFHQLYAVLKDNKTFPSERNAPLQLKNHAITMWQGKPEDKLEAIKRLAAASTPSTPSTTPAVAVEKKADDMARRLLEAKNAVASRTSPSANHGHSPQGSPVDSRQVTFGEDPIPDHLEGPILSGIKDLKALLPLLELGASYRDLQAALEKLMLLELNGVQVPFRISGNAPSSISERPCYHLYYIHKNESPESLVSDPKYGNNAMAGVHPASNADRQRAVQRTIVELALEGLEDAINLGETGAIIALTNMLEEDMLLQTTDVPHGHQNLAHTLFGAMYTQHCEARRTNSSLIDPSDRQFNNDFGRNAFRSVVDGVNPETKLAAISAIRQLLKAAWKVQ